MGISEFNVTLKLFMRKALKFVMLLSQLIQKCFLSKVILTLLLKETNVAHLRKNAELLNKPIEHHSAMTSMMGEVPMYAD